ncbi:MAG: pyrimidine dimer DNA glycosylase /DNA-(apurinic or apyrimidinic site) lyase [Gammaproteobacteria bacterium]|nr:MAG: pyrimidine dimer DNA glycosylase /DNA-(apurinic or apyrimidinic site) lyase [Gammaproteobacteria bacterium]
MRLWSLHPRYLDRVGLLACWREALLAKAVLAGRTRGYRHHPQLDRFRAAPDPLAAVDAYLAGLWAEAARRGYRFDPGKFAPGTRARLTVTDGQLRFEWAHLLDKLATRDPARHARLCARRRRPEAHEIFTVRCGPVEAFERGRRP